MQEPEFNIAQKIDKQASELFQQIHFDSIKFSPCSVKHSYNL